MGFGRSWSGSSHRLTLLLAGVLLIPALTLVGLGLALLQQDRELSAQRAAERREAAVAGVARALEESVAATEDLLSAGSIPEGALRITVTPAGIRADPRGRALWTPVLTDSTEADSQPFAEAERLEFRGSEQKASLLYEQMAGSPRESVRAGALLRLARVYRRTRQVPAALGTYRRLAVIDAVSIDGTPASLLARRERCRLLAEAGRREQLKQEAAALRHDLASGRWTLDHIAWLLAAEDVGRLEGSPLKPTPEQQAFAELQEWLWQEVQRAGVAGFPSSGRRAVYAGDMVITLLWRGASDRVEALAVAPSLVGSWAERASAAVRQVDARLSLTDSSGHILFGSSTSSRQGTVRRTSDETRLPWTLTLTPGDGVREPEELRVRRQLLSAGLVAVVMLLGTGSFLLWRLVQRELAVARLQTDFVSAVSHEFRTPLTSLGHFTELLQEGDEPSPSERQAFYSALARNTKRLRRLVESLLDFARMEAGRRPYDLRTMDAGSLAAQVVEEFRKEAEPHGFTVNLDVAAPAVHWVEADPAALTHALWNLLDNATKYSGDARTVWVTVKSLPQGTAISVRDEGAGIPPREQKQIFRKFVRGEQARRLRVEGTGIGLAIVSHIVRAHGGKVTVESAPGRGSTFTIILPKGRNQEPGVGSQGPDAAPIPES
ncbi:MAG: yycG 2 [candidate division NC10 bacterium]|nr:yycG 2 [candidate division NC10 bacterium]